MRGEPDIDLKISYPSKGILLTLHTTQHYFVVRGYLNGVQQVYYRSTVYYRAKMKFEQLERMANAARKINSDDSSERD